MSTLDRIQTDLLNVEVNTIIKADISGSSMPSLPFALLDVIECYAFALLRMGLDLRPYFEPSARQLRALLPELYAKREDDPQLVIYFNTARVAYLEHTGGEISIGEPSEAERLWPYLPDLWPVFTLLEARAADEPGEANEGAWTFSMDEVSNGWDSFERLRIAAHRANDRGLEGAPLRRIIRSCDVLKFMTQGLEQRFEHKRRAAPHFADWSELVPKTREQLLRGGLHDKQVPALLRAEDFRNLRKIWELGAEHIAVQTSVQVDGDLVTRISSKLLEQHSQAVQQLVLGVHHESVGSGLRHWQFLVETVRKLFSGLFSSFRRL